MLRKLVFILCFAIVFCVFLFPLIPLANRDNPKLARSAFELRNFDVAIRNAESVHGHFDRVVKGQSGEPLLSWRVHLLPYLLEDSLFRQFNQLEPWDSPPNKPLSEEMPPCYETWLDSLPPGTTRIQLVTGPNTVFEHERLDRNDIPDGASTTIMMLEVNPPVPWTKPADWVYDPDKPLPTFGANYRKLVKSWWGRKDYRPCFNALFADGSVRFLWQDTDEKVLRAMFTRNAGEAINLDDLP